MAMTEEEKQARKRKRFDSIPGKRSGKVVEIMGLKGKAKAGESSKLELDTKEKMAPGFKPFPSELLSDADVAKESDARMGDLKQFEKVQKLALKAVKSGDAEKASDITLNKKDKKKVISTIKNPKKLEKAVKKTEAAVEGGKKPSLADAFTGAFMKSIPLLLGTALGGVDVGVAAQEGANSAEAAEAKAAMDKEKLQLDKDTLAEKKFQFDATLQFKKDNAQFQAGIKQQLAQLKAQGANDKDLEKFIPGVGFALTKDDAKKGKEILDITNDLASQLDSLIELRSDKGAEFLDRDSVSRGKAAATNLKLMIKDAAKLGVMSEQDKELLDTMIPDDPLQVDVLTDTPAQLQEVRRIYVNRLNSFFESRGLPVPNFKGNPKTDAEARRRRIEELEAKR